MGLVGCFQKQRANYLHVMDETQGPPRYMGRIGGFTGGLQGCSGRESVQQLEQQSFCFHTVSLGGNGQGRTPLREGNLETD